MKKLLKTCWGNDLDKAFGGGIDFIRIRWIASLFFITYLIWGCDSLDTIEKTEEYASNTYWNGKIQGLMMGNKNDYSYAFKLFGDKTACIFIETPITGIVRADGYWSVTSVGKINVHFNPVGEYPSKNYTINLIEDSQSFQVNDIKYEKMENPAEEYLLKTCPDMSR